MENEKLKIDTRRKRIMELLAHNGEVQVAALSRELGATAVTIRSDLDALERSGTLERVPGGAVQSSAGIISREFMRRRLVNSDAKKRIAQAAANIIQDGDTVMINSGTTTYYTAFFLKKRKNLRIVTNSFFIASELGAVPSFNVILLGGETNYEDSFTYGSDALEQLKKYKANYAILSIDGVCPDSGVSTLHAEEALVERLMIERAGETVVVADSSKLGREGFLHVCGIESIDRLVTEKGANAELLKRFRSAGIKVNVG